MKSVALIIFLFSIASSKNIGEDVTCKGSSKTQCVSGSIQEHSNYRFPQYNFLTFLPLSNTTIKNETYGIDSTLDEQVKGFYISHNQKVKFLPKSLANKFPKLVQVTVEACGVKRILRENFEVLSELKAINLYRNQIADIEEGSFDDLTKLEYLNLGWNKLKSLHENLLYILTNLKNLNLAFNFLEEIDENLIGGLKNLRRLELNGNKLTTLDEDLFLELIKLEYLDLSDNQIAELPSNILSNLGELKTIKFCGNKFEKLPEEFYGNNTKVEVDKCEDAEVLK